jgi:hypothetical protein
MRKTPLIFIPMLFLTSALFAQVSLGVYGGAASGNFSGDAPKKAKYRPKIGYNMGLSVEVQVKEDVLISFKPGFYAGGAKLQFQDSTGENYVDSVIFDYGTILVPVMMKIVSNNQKWHFTGGLEASFPFKLEADDSEQVFDLIDDVSDVGLNILFGIGYRIPTGKSHLAIDLTYAQGLLNIVDNLEEGERFIPRIKPTAIRFNLAWDIPLKQKNKDQ